MRLLWIIVALALIQCSYGEEDESTVSEDLIDEVFNRDTKPKKDATNGSPSPPPQDKTTGAEPTCSNCTPTAEDPNLSPKVSNVSQSRVRAPHFQI